jgi:hypothetical protein
VADLLHAGRTITEIAFELRITRHYVRRIVRQMEPESAERKPSPSERPSQVLVLLRPGSNGDRYRAGYYPPVRAANRAWDPLRAGDRATG